MCSDLRRPDRGAWSGCGHLGKLGGVCEARQPQVGQQLHGHAVAEHRERLLAGAVAAGHEGASPRLASLRTRPSTAAGRCAGHFRAAGLKLALSQTEDAQYAACMPAQRPLDESSPALTQGPWPPPAAFWLCRAGPPAQGPSATKFQERFPTISCTHLYGLQPKIKGYAGHDHQSHSCAGYWHAREA